MWTAFPPSDYYADSATPCARQPASGLAGPPPAARRARSASHVHHDPFDRVGSWLYPYSPSGGHSQHPAGHRAQTKQPGAERAAVKQSGVVAVDDPDPPGFGSFKESRGFYHQFAFALPFGLASTHAGVWQYRPAVALSGALDLRRAIPRLGRPQLLRAAASARGRHSSRHGRDVDVRHLLSHGASWRRFTFLGFTHICATTKSGRFKLKRVTDKKRMRSKLSKVKAELIRRRDLPIPDQGRWLASVLRGHFNYYAVPDNGKAITTFRYRVTQLWLRALRRRSQRHRMTWQRIGFLADRWLPPARILHPWPNDRFDARTQGSLLCQGRVGICGFPGWGEGWPDRAERAKSGVLSVALGGLRALEGLRTRRATSARLAIGL